LRKVLIISYYYPPCNLTAAQRVGSWVKYMPENGYYPILITRNWTGHEFTATELLENSNRQEHHVRNEKSEIYYLPYKASLRDYFFRHGQKNVILKLMSKILTTLNILIRHISVNFISYNNIYYKAKELLKENPEINYLIISADPFEQFHFGYKLKKEFPNLKWVADYRDDWTTSDIDFHPFRLIQKYFEKKWIHNSSLITTTSNQLVLRLSDFHKKRTELILNGFEFPENFNITSLQKNKNKLTILHNGTLYPSQDLTILRDALSEIEIQENFSIELIFPGLKYINKVAQRIENEFSGLPVKFESSSRISRVQLIKLQLESDIMLMVAHKGEKGIVGSKLYEYIGLKKPVLLCPSDRGEMQSTLEGTGLEIIVQNKEDLKNKLMNLIKLKQEFGEITLSPNNEKIKEYSRRNQVEKIALLFKQI
jgi:hypothetical protein